MQWFRTKTHAIRLLVALFLVAQFAGVVSSPLAQAHAAAGVAIAHASHTRPSITKPRDIALTVIVTTHARIRMPAHAPITPTIAARCTRSLPAFFYRRRRSTMPSSPARRCVRL